VLHAAGYKVWVYGSASTVFSNPGLNGYWVADYASIWPFMYNHSGVRATQYAPGEYYGSFSIKDWTYYSGTWWRVGPAALARFTWSTNAAQAAGGRMSRAPSGSRESRTITAAGRACATSTH